MTQEKKQDASEIEILNLRHKFQVEDQKNQNQWRSCCGRLLDKRAVVYFTQIALISLTMLFTVYQLITVENCEGQHVYIGLLMFLLSIITPSPKFNAK
jgi:hypothetical protein